jgi:GDSL-like lipase/acylhydrolase family protein
MRAPFSRSAVAAAVVGLASGYVAWAQQPERLVTQIAAPPKAVWTPTSDAPKGLLTKLEGERHDRFIDRARAGDIDIVFFGDTATEMWRWPDRGRSVWDRAFGSRNAADFGTQGTRPESLPWRMRNGELDGYRAKVVVLQAFGVGDYAIPGDRLAEVVANYAVIIAEVRARQPQAKVLFFAAFPRGVVGREPWRRVAEANAAAAAALVDDEAVFYIDIGDRFFRPDGSHESAMWTTGAVDPGIQTPAFEVWADVLEPWLDRFVR